MDDSYSGKSGAEQDIRSGGHVSRLAEQNGAHLMSWGKREGCQC